MPATNLSSQLRRIGLDYAAVHAERLGLSSSSPAAATTLQKRRELSHDGITISLETDGGLPHAFEDGPVLAIRTSDKSLDKLDMLGAPALCAVP